MTTSRGSPRSRTKRAGLPALAAGLSVDGRQLDEITLFLLDDGALAAGALYFEP